MTLLSLNIGHAIQIAKRSSSFHSLARLKDKVAVITGSTKGIGFGIAKRFAQEGAEVLISSRSQNNVNRAVNELIQNNLKVSGVVCHVEKSEDRKNLFEQIKSKFGHLDILVSNVAVNPHIGSIMECPEDKWDKIFNVNVKSTFLLMKESLPLLRQSSFPSITLISSSAAFHPLDIIGAYSVSKTALIGLCNVSAKKLAPEKIRVNCISPGLIDTEFSAVLCQSESVCQEIFNGILLKRIGTSEDISGTAAFLASEDAKFITGETITVCGGLPGRL